MSHPNPSTALATVVIDELVRAGVSVFLSAPGSRSTALVLAVERHPGAELVMTIDERSAAFNALGRAKATGRPAAVIATSGTAAANLLPAVVEADLAETPLIVVTADRPTELRGVGANQAIDQVGMFGRFVRRATDTGPAEPRAGAPGWWRSIISQSVASARGFGARPGPVHLNVPFREPTVPVSDDGRTRDEPYLEATDGRTEDAPWTLTLTGRAPGRELVEEVTARIDRAEKGLIIAGGGASSASVAELGRHLGWPVLATAESGLRGREDVITAGHHLVAHARPDLILRFGPPGPSRRILDLIESEVDQLVVGSGWSDPGRTACLMVDTDGAALAAALVTDTSERQSGEWLAWWETADRAVRQVLQPELERSFSEPAIAARVGASEAELLVVASSMPIRDVESYAFVVPHVVANRGASGIDGFISTALGASAGVERPVALAGDLSFLHDGNGFLTDPPGRSVFVVLDNQGGGIFSFLPQAQHIGPEFERLFGTPHHRDLAGLAEFHGVRHRDVESLVALDDALQEGWKHTESSVIVARLDRQENVAEHDRLARLAAEAAMSVST